MLAPSLMGDGASSTNALASFKPRPVMARTALITFTFLSPALDSTTSNSSFSSPAAASPPPAPTTGAAATAAAAETPNFSSISEMSSTTSITLISAIAFNTSSLDNAIFSSPKF
uniref:50S ribosomal protein L7/L12 n=1 Tax=uncultured gamma proteobacterium HF0010_16J05 TaxID=710981 RepID=E0XR28_9GAMM|nr:hypothetical protein [uncultured gamma proteobacterium HF0010_16J05]